MSDKTFRGLTNRLKLLEDLVSERSEKTKFVSSTAGASIDVLEAKTIHVSVVSDIVDLTIPTDPTRVGKVNIFIFEQDEVGGHEVTWDTDKFIGGVDVGVPILHGAANSIDIITVMWLGNPGKFVFLTQLRGYEL